jgi:hypothetical protein
MRFCIESVYKKKLSQLNFMSIRPIKTLLYLALEINSNKSVTNSMGQSPSFQKLVGSQEISHLLWNLKVYYHVHKRHCWFVF